MHHTCPLLPHARTLPLEMLNKALDSARLTQVLLEQEITRRRKMIDHAEAMKAWRKERRDLVNVIAQHLYDGLSANQVAVAVSKQTGLEVGAIMAAMPRARFQIDRLNRARRDRFIMQQMRRGFTNAEICAATGLSLSQVQRIISKNRQG